MKTYRGKLLKSLVAFVFLFAAVLCLPQTALAAIELGVGETTTVSWQNTFYPNIGDYAWYSTDATIAKVSPISMKTGRITAVRNGTCSIKCTILSWYYHSSTVYDEKVQTYSWTVTVGEGGVSVTPSPTSGPGPTPTPRPTSGTCGGGQQKWKIDSSGTLTITGNGAIPKWDTDGALWDRNRVYKVVIGSGITEIGEKAFYNSWVSSITLPSTLKKIGSSAFGKCPLSSISLPSSLTEIGDSAFSECQNLTSISLPKNLKVLGSGAFYRTGLTSVSIPASVSTLGSGIFMQCDSLASVSLPSGLTEISSEMFYGCQKLASVQIPSTVQFVGPCAFYDCSALTNLTFPASVAYIEEYALGGCSSLTEVSFSGSNTILPERLFSGLTALETVNLPSKLTEIPATLCYGCTNLSSINLPNTLTSIGGYAFFGCESLSAIELPAGMRSIGDYAFSESGVTSLALNSGLESIGKNAFYKCTDLGTRLEFPDSLTSLGEYAFANCGRLMIVRFGDGLIQIPDGAFADCDNLILASFNDAIKSIGISAFRGAAIESLQARLGEWPASLESIGSYAFADCPDLYMVGLPASLTTLGTHAFDNCDSLEDVVFEDGITTIGSYAFNDCDSLAYVELPATLKKIEGYAFYECSDLTSISLPKGLTSIGNYAFSYTNLGGVLLPTSLTSYPVCSFCDTPMTDAYYDGYYNETIFDKLAKMFDSGTNIHYRYYGKLDNGFTWKQDGYKLYITGSGAFNKCTEQWNRKEIKAVYFNSGITSIKSGFYGFQWATSLYFPTTISSIGDYVFDAVTTVHYQGMQNRWGVSVGYGNGVMNYSDFKMYRLDYGYSKYDFGQTAPLYSGVLNLPKNLYLIEEGGFQGVKVSEVYCPEGLISIGKNSFNACKNLRAIYIPSTYITIDSTAFSDCSSDLTFYCRKGSNVETFAKSKGFQVSYI